MWKGSQESQKQTYSLKKSIEKVCFVDDRGDPKGVDSSLYTDFTLFTYAGDNLLFYPLGKASINSVKIEHVDLNIITRDQNPKCFNNIDGKITLTIKKDFGEPLVEIL